MHIFHVFVSPQIYLVVISFMLVSYFHCAAKQNYLRWSSRTPCLIQYWLKPSEPVHDLQPCSGSWRSLWCAFWYLGSYALWLHHRNARMRRYMQIAETGRPFRRLFRRLHSRPRHYHYGTTTTCPLELGPEVNDTMCDLFQVPSYTEATPQHCAEQCQEVYGDTTGVIDFDPATTECRCCVGNGTRTSAEKSNIFLESKPCGGPFKPCGDRGVGDFWLLHSGEHNMHGQHRISGVYWPDTLRRRMYHYAGGHLSRGGQQQHSLRVLQTRLSYRTSYRFCYQHRRLRASKPASKRAQ